MYDKKYAKDILQDFFNYDNNNVQTDCVKRTAYTGRIVTEGTKNFRKS